MSEPIVLKDTLEEQVAKAHDMIGNMCSERRPPKMSIPAGGLVNANPCGDEDLYIGQVLDNQQGVIEFLLDHCAKWAMIDTGMGHSTISKERWLKLAMESLETDKKGNTK